jgi:hypothetical protein
VLLTMKSLMHFRLLFGALMFFSPFVALADSAAAHRQKAAQFRALADEQDADARNLIAHNDSVDARQNEKEAQILRNAAAAEDNVANQMESASAGAGGSGYGGYNAPSGGNDKGAVLGQLAGQVGNMVGLLQQIQDRKNAEAQQEALQAQRDRDQAAADVQAKELQQQADDAEKKVEDQQKLASLRQQYGGLYQSTDPKSGDAPAVGSTLSSWISTAPAATASPAATGDTSAMVSDVIGDSSASSPGTASNAQTSALVDSVLADGPAPSQPASDTPSGASGAPSVQADNSKSPSMVDDVLNGPGSPAPASTATDGQLPTGAASAPDADAAETAALAKQGINPATIHSPPEENDGTGAPLFLGQNLNKGPYAGTNLSGPLPDVVADCNKAKPFPKDTPAKATSSPSLPAADQTPAEIEALAKQGIHPANFHSPPEEDVGTGAPLFLGENLNKGPSAGMNLSGPNPDLTKALNLQPTPAAGPAPAVDQKNRN